MSRVRVPLPAPCPRPGGQASRARVGPEPLTQSRRGAGGSPCGPIRTIRRFSLRRRPALGEGSPSRGPRRGMPTDWLPANQVRAVVGVQTSRAMLGIVGGAEANPTDQLEVRARTGSPDQRASTASRGQGTVVGRPSPGFRTRPIPPSPRRRPSRRPSRRCPGSGGMSRRSRSRRGGGLGTRSSGRSPSWWWSPWRS
jgi:hypothetical protein